MKFKSLFEPIQIGTMSIKNRFVVPPMSYFFKEDHHAIDFYKERAKGGFGLIIHDAVAVSELGTCAPGGGAFWEDSRIPVFQKVTDAVHEYDCKIIVQLLHAGRQSYTYMDGRSVAPSRVADPNVDSLPVELSVAQIYQIIDDFGETARRSRDAGFDGVEIHAAHGYLIAEFLSPQANKRYDEFGGDFQGRMKFLIEIIKSIKLKAGSNFPIVVRLSAEEDVHGGLKPEMVSAIAREVEAYGVDAINVSVANYSNMLRYMASAEYAPGLLQEYSARIKESVQIPVMVVGRINTPYIADDILRTGKADMVCLGRPSISEPAFPNKVASGNLDDISPCVACNQGCMGASLSGYPTSCVINPLAGRESEGLLTKAEKIKKIMVVGAGPAGLYAAWTAARRGHTVSLYEKTDKIGGQYRIAGIPPIKYEIFSALKFYLHMCKKSGVQIYMNTEVSDALIAQEMPDAVILATGSTPIKPRIKNIDGITLIDAKDILDGKCHPGEKVLVCGGGLVGAETATFLGEHRRKVTVIEMNPEIAADELQTHKPVVLKMLEEFKVELIADAKITEFYDDGVHYQKKGQEYELREFDTIVNAMGSKAYNPLEELIRDKVAEVYVIGDAVQARNIFPATREALYTAAKL